MPKYLMLVAVLMLIPALTSANAKQDEVKEVQKLKKYDEQCAQFDKKSCEILLTKLGQMCKKPNAFACFRLGEIATINTEIAARQGLIKDSVQWLDLAVGTTKRACQGNIPQACEQMKKFKSKFQDSCNKGDKLFCKAIKLI